MKRIAFTLLLLMGTATLAHAQDFDTYCTQKVSTRGLKKVVEKSFGGWKTVYHYDEQGYLRLEEHFRKGRKRGEYTYDYIISDSLLEVRQPMTWRRDSAAMFVSKFFYDAQGRCRRMERMEMSGDRLKQMFSLDDSCVYDGSRLMGYTRYGAKGEVEDKYVYTYDAQGRKSMVKRIWPNVSTEYRQFKYDDKGQLTDYILEDSNPKAMYMCVPVWSGNKTNKVHYRYCNFDKHGNWTKRYFMTAHGKVFGARRKLEYWR